MSDEFKPIDRDNKGKEAMNLMDIIENKEESLKNAGIRERMEILSNLVILYYKTSALCNDISFDLIQYKEENRDEVNLMFFESQGASCLFFGEDYERKLRNERREFEKCLMKVQGKDYSPYEYPYEQIDNNDLELTIASLMEIIENKARLRRNSAEEEQIKILTDLTIQCYKNSSINSLLGYKIIQEKGLALSDELIVCSDEAYRYFQGGEEYEKQLWEEKSKKENALETKE
jgi:hypothetical protein